MAKKTGVGTSAFTHVDDVGADVHVSNPLHQDALHYGGQVPPKHELAEVVLGPPPFGSPDPRTLGHHMLGGASVEHPASARELDPEFEANRRRMQLAGAADDKQLNDMTKDELKQYADQRGISIRPARRRMNFLVQLVAMVLTIVMMIAMTMLITPLSQRLIFFLRLKSVVLM